jgi:hypothetical protein
VRDFDEAFKTLATADALLISGDALFLSSEPEIVAAWPLAVRAQQPVKMKRIAFVHASAKVRYEQERSTVLSPRFFKELGRLGYVEG